MANAKKHNAYRGLIVWMLVLLALAALACAGYLYTQNYLDRRVKENAAEVEQINANRTADYNAAVAEVNRQNQAARSDETKWPTPASQGWDVLDISNIPVGDGTQVSVTRTDMLQGGLLVVNRWHPMPADLTDNMMVSVNRHSRADEDKENNIPTKDASVSMLPPAVEAMMEMYKEARAAGLDMDNIIVEEGYRTMETQSRNWTEEEAKWSSRYTGDKLTEKVRASVAYPGTSDYQAGMSFKVYNYKSGDSAFSNTPLHETEQGRWIYENGWKYGYVYRFPIQGFPYPDTVDKSFITGVSIKKVYRFVGRANAIAMHATGMCLEEYAEYLMEHPHIAVYEDGQLRCEIYRMEGGYSDTMVTIPKGAVDYTVSSDNLGGMVVAVQY